MSYKLQIFNLHKWEKDLSTIPEKEKKKIASKIRGLKIEPWPDGIQVKKLTNHDIADFRLRVGDYRILFIRDQETHTIKLLHVRHRSKAY
ncbi:MAG: plasmid stabilization system [Parcubacteria group bacterium Gr01-1014_18]|nr:MAG: plasmid stabilization system [Parcubacteria group bacterium Greene0416_36]TSC81141.1 MAG: plasmid stabilization system [Parcubacteria group bacterium Gr01-1014_18]TSC98442.1 MAG: plasmid stabilization system [Parcubacteria group bacterium Greene1014_20]TSD07392.1 MAG: plasmid stabilization system [Parcubacteria group bacterium Greene0714_2]